MLVPGDQEASDGNLTYWYRSAQNVVLSSVHGLYGDVGLPGEVDVLQVLLDKTAVLRVPFGKRNDL